jgi:hypothetical protein
MRWTHWAAIRHHVGMGGRRCMVTLEQNWLGELIWWVKMVLVAR